MKVSLELCWIQVNLHDISFYIYYSSSIFFVYFFFTEQIFCRIFNERYQRFTQQSQVVNGSEEFGV